MFQDAPRLARFQYPEGRIIGFDLLRGIAILLTLFRHTYAAGNWLYEVGWISVHIFFVLSSYLILDILFRERVKTGKINYWRFFIRRGLKIYPLYYLFILVAVWHNHDFIFGKQENTVKLVGQLIHVQNYWGPLWYHTWSLAAEEHFYLTVCVVLSILIALFPGDLFRKWMVFCTGIIVLSLILRILDQREHPQMWFQATHLVMDSFAWGGLLAGCKYAYPLIFEKLIGLRHWLLLPLFLCLLPLMLLPLGGFAMMTIGHSFMYLAFTISLAYLISIEKTTRGSSWYARFMARPLAWFGIASYSIYLFHLDIRTVVYRFISDPLLEVYVYVLVSILVGRMLWWIVEMPIARWKERH